MGTRVLHLATQQFVVVVSVHICANWRNPDTQVAQVDAMLAKLENVVQQGDSLIIGGDFNSTPTSGVYELLSKGMLGADHPDVFPKDVQVLKLCGAEGYRSNLKLASAYATLLGAEPEFTTFEGISPQSPEKVPFSGTLDYLWYSHDALQPVPDSALCTPSREYALQENGIPSSEIPSDHVPLGLALSFATRIVGRADGK